MNGKYLGKITRAEFGTVKYHPFLMGLQLDFSFDGSGCSCGGKYTVNISGECKWKDQSERQATITKHIDEVHQILTAAKVNYVSQLVGKPVEVTIEDNTFKDFRILTEVL